MILHWLILKLAEYYVIYMLTRCECDEPTGKEKSSAQITHTTIYNKIHKSNSSNIIKGKPVNKKFCGGSNEGFPSSQFSQTCLCIWLSLCWLIILTNLLLHLALWWFIMLTNLPLPLWLFIISYNRIKPASVIGFILGSSTISFVQTISWITFENELLRTNNSSVA